MGANLWFPLEKLPLPAPLSWSGMPVQLGSVRGKGAKNFPFPEWFLFRMVHQGGEDCGAERKSDVVLFVPARR